MTEETESLNEQAVGSSIIVVEYVLEYDLEYEETAVARTPEFLEDDAALRIAQEEAEQSELNGPEFSFTEAQLTCRGPCPFTEILPTEIVALIAGNLDKKSLLAFRTTNPKIADRVGDAFKKTFNSVQYALPNPEEYQRCKDLGESKYSDLVQSLTCVEEFRDDFLSIGRDTMRLIESPRYFKNLKCIVLRTDFIWEDVYNFFGGPSLEADFSRMFGHFKELLSGFKRPLTIKIESNDIVSCEFRWTGNGTTKDLKIRNLRKRELIARDFDKVRQESYPSHCFYNTALATMYSETMELLSPREVRLSGLEIRIKDLELLLRMADVPEVLEVKDCTLRFDGSVDMNWAWLDNISFSLWRNARHVSFLDIKATLYRGNSWFYLFRSLSDSTILESFRFERVENVFFDWDGDGNLDDGKRLPGFIEELGVRQAMRKMAACYKHLQPTYDFTPAPEWWDESD